jgi:hypothetical protein
MALTTTLEPPEFEKFLGQGDGPLRGRPATGRTRSTRHWSWLVYFVLVAIYLGLGLLLMLHYGYHNGDAEGRTANASYVLFSRSPHVAAVGFVWNPLPSLAELPILGLAPLWPALKTSALAGVFMSAPFMAGTVIQLRAIAIERGVRQRWRFALVALFAFNPLVVLYATNGQSEAPYLFFTIWAVHRLMRWLDSDRVGDLVVAGIALGLDFLTRYETVAIAAAAFVLVCFVTTTRASAPRRTTKFRLGLVDGAIVVLPFTLCFVGWALGGWILTGSAFAQFSSVYGNTSQISLGHNGVSRALLPAISEATTQVLAMAQMLPIVILLALFVTTRRGDLGYLPPLFLFGSGIAFVIVSYLAGSIIDNLRYYSLELPLLAVSAVMMIPTDLARPHLGGTLTKRTSPVLSTRTGQTVFGVLAICLVALSIPPMTVAAMNPDLDPSDYGIKAVFTPHQFALDRVGESSGLAYGTAIAQAISVMGLHRGEVLLDTWAGFPIALGAKRLDTFTITSDLDFTAALNDPRRFGVSYFLVPAPTGVGALDAINRRYPRFFGSGLGFATLTREFTPSQPSLPKWRLYLLNSARAEITS